MRILVVVSLLAALALGVGAQVTGAPQASYQPKSATDKAHSDSEFTAIAYLRTLAYSEKVYYRKHQQYPASLAGLVGTISFTKRMAEPKRGDYTVIYHAQNDGYTVVLRPLAYDASHRSFFIDESGDLRVEATKPAGKNSPLLKEQE